MLLEQRAFLALTGRIKQCNSGEPCDKLKHSHMLSVSEHLPVFSCILVPNKKTRIRNGVASIVATDLTGTSSRLLTSPCAQKFQVLIGWMRRKSHPPGSSLEDGRCWFAEGTATPRPMKSLYHSCKHTVAIHYNANILSYCHASLNCIIRFVFMSKIPAKPKAKYTLPVLFIWNSP